MERAGGTFLQCKMLNLSWGGLALALADAGMLTPDEQVFVELPLGGASSQLRTPCRVVGIGEDAAHLAFLDESDFFRRTVEASLSVWQDR